MLKHVITPSNHHCAIYATTHYFANRVINVWNSLSNYVASAPSVSAVKKRVSHLSFLFNT